MRVARPKNKIPNPIPYNRNGKDGILKYVEQFDKLNNLKSGATVVNGKRV